MTMKYKAHLKGHHTLIYESATHDLEIEAKDYDDARKQALKWCKDHTMMGGYEWFLKTIEQV